MSTGKRYFRLNHYLKNPVLADDRRFQRGIAWIREHPNASSDELPDQLLSDWLDGEPLAFKLAIWVCAYLINRIDAGLIEKGGSLVMTDGELEEGFNCWIALLSVISTHRAGVVRLAQPLPLFDMRVDEKFRASLRSAPPGAHGPN